MVVQIMNILLNSIKCPFLIPEQYGSYKTYTLDCDTVSCCVWCVFCKAKSWSGMVTTVVPQPSEGAKVVWAQKSILGLRPQSYHLKQTWYLLISYAVFFRWPQMTYSDLIVSIVHIIVDYGTTIELLPYVSSCA